MLATAQPSSAQSQPVNCSGQVASYPLFSPDSGNDDFWCSADNPDASVEDAVLSPSPGSVPLQVQQSPSPVFDGSVSGVRQEQISESDSTNEDEPFLTNMFPGLPCADSSSSAVVYEGQDPTVQQLYLPGPSNQAYFPRGDMKVVPQYAVFPSKAARGDGAGDAVPKSVASGKAVGDLVMCENDGNVKPEYSVSLPRMCKPMKISGDALGSFPFLQGIELPAILGGKLPPRSLKPKPKKRVYTERELRSRRKRGLPDDSDSESEERRQVRLPRRSLLTITTAQMSQVANFMRSNLSLTPSQQDEISKQKRLVKNRESACRFRAKKVLSLIEYRDRVMELENDVAYLRAENEKLRNALLEANSSVMKTQLDIK